MRIDRLCLQGVGAFREECTFDFPQEGAVLTGDNESGKTSLAWALYGAFFGVPAGRISLDDDAAWVEVDFTARGRSFRVRRDFKTRNVVLSELSGQDVTVLFEGRAERPVEEEGYREALERHAGLSEAKVWLHSGAVLDGQLETKLGRTLRSGMGGSAASPQSALNRLKNKLERATAGEGRGPGPLDAVRAELDASRQDLERATGNAADVRAQRVQVTELEAERAMAQQTVTVQEDVIERLRRFDEICRERTRLEDDLLRLRRDRDRIRQHVEAVEELQRKLERDFEDFLDSPAEMEELIATSMDQLVRLALRERELERGRQALAALPRSHPVRSGGIAGVVVGAGGWLAFLGAGVPAVGLIIAPLLAVGAGGLFWYFSRHSQSARAARFLEVQQLEAECQELRAVDADIRGHLGKLGNYRDPNQLRREVRRYAHARAALDRARSVRDSHPPMAEAMNGYEMVLTEIQVLDTQIREMVASARYLSGLDASTERMAGAFEKARTRMEEARSRADSLGVEILGLEASLAQAAAGPQHVPRLREEIAWLTTREQEIAFRVGALRLAVEMLDAAIAAHHDGDIDRVALRASNHLAAFSQGEHDGVRWNAEFEPEVHTPGTGWHAVARLSAGARDQFHLALRLALVEEQAPDVGFPILLDDAFLRWDAERLGVAQRVLDDLVAQGRQLLITSAGARKAGDSQLIRLGPSRRALPRASRRAA